MPAKITISLGEGNTPLLKASDSLTKYFGLANLWIKHEEMNPTGCFKDRESALVVPAGNGGCLAGISNPPRWKNSSGKIRKQLKIFTSNLIK